MRYVPIDFAADDMTDVLKNVGFDTDVPAFFAILGVTYYLMMSVFEQTLEKISSISAVGNRLVFDFPDETTFTGNGSERVRRLAQITAKLGEPMQYGFSVSEIRRALRRHGFVIKTHETPNTIQKRFFEHRSDGQKAFENIHFIIAEKKEIK